MAKRQYGTEPTDGVEEFEQYAEDTSTDNLSGGEGAKKFDLKNISGTPLFPIFDGEQLTMFPNDIITREMSTYEDCMLYIASFNDGIIVTRIY